MKTLKLLNRLYPNCTLVGVYNVFFANSGWTITERHSLFFSCANVTERQFDKVLKGMLLNQEIKIEKVCFEVLFEGQTKYVDYYPLEILEVL